MSEIPRFPTSSGGERTADVVDLASRRLDNERLDPYELSDADAADLFVSELIHPARHHSSAEVGDYITDMLGPFTREDIDDSNVAWRTRLLGLMVDVDSLDDVQLRSLLEDDNVINDIYVALLETYDQAETMQAERKAFRLLCDLRAGMVAREDTSQESDKRWQRLIVFLRNGAKNT